MPIISKLLHRNQYSLYLTMGKKKQQKQYRLNYKKDDKGKEKMNDILKELSEMKQDAIKKGEAKGEAMMDMGLYKKKIKKDEKLQKYMKKKDNGEAIEEQIEEVAVQVPKLNIFAVDEYESGIKTVLNVREIEEKHNEYKLSDQTNVLFGGQINMDTFGEKPLKVIEEEQNVVLSDDQDQPNSLKNITHPNLAIPEGNYRFNRKKEIEEFREKLPIFMKEQEIIETINNHLVTLICGETGSGKSTQIGQFLIEKNYCKYGKVVITQPRRLATIALANRVAEETGNKLGQLVGFQVRHERRDSPSTLIKYLTDGILLNEMSSDYLLNAYGVIVIDEAHERKINTDILIGLLSKLVLLRYKLSLQGKGHPLRLVIMSATMRVQDFQNERLFDYKVPIINVEARMFPVTVYFEKQTPEDYKQAAVKKCLMIHKKLPVGDVLVFLTGKEEIHEVAILLENALNRDEMEESDGQHEMIGEQMEANHDEKPKNHLIHCLYSSLPMPEQQKIFKPTPQGCRKFIISTNIAQTSITIPNIRYVIDSGQQKHRYHEGVWKWRKGWGSRAMAEQRSGRAGRTAHGYCYRLYSAALYANIMEEYPLPEISKLPLEGVLLQLKAIGIPNVYTFPFPTAPDLMKIKTTLANLLDIQAVQGIIQNEAESTTITQLGNILSFLPLDPKLGKILLMGRKMGVEKHSLLLVILLTVESIFLDENYKVKISAKMQQENLKGKYIQEMKMKVNTFKNKYRKYIMEEHFGDIFTCINILGDFFTRLFKEKGNIQNKIRKEAKQLELNQNVLREIYYNTDQIAEIYETLCNEKMDFTEYKQPDNKQITALLDVLLDAFLNNLCKLESKNKYKNKNDQVVVVHHLSDTYLKNNLFLGCTEFYGSEQGRTYMRYPFPVQNYELLASYGKISPPNDFAWRNNQVVGLSSGTIFNWQIPNLFVQDVDSDVKYYYVAKYLLEGKILEPLKTLEKYLKAPSSIIKPGSLDYKVQKLVEVFKIHKISTLSTMQQWWNKDKRFLKQQLRQWVTMKNFDEIYEKIRKSVVAIKSK